MNLFHLNKRDQDLAKVKNKKCNETISLRSVTIQNHNSNLDGAICRCGDQLPPDELARPDATPVAGEGRQQAEVVGVPDFAGLILRGRRHEVSADVDRVDVL